MNLMSDHLKKISGSGAEVLLYRLTDKPLKSLLIGTGITALIQSSSAVSAMVVSLTESRIMKLKQAIPVIIGTILGTSATGWIIAYSSITFHSANILKIFSASVLSAVFAITGIAEAAKNISNKEEIGEKGIGFKSVFGVAERVLIESGWFSFSLYRANFTIPRYENGNNHFQGGTKMTLFVPHLSKKIYEEMHPDIIDINMGCPVPKVALKAQAGSALLKDPKKIKEIVEAVVASVPCPVTVKIRSGWDEKNINAIEVAKVCESAGASAIAVHARTRSQGYSGHADWNIIKAVKENVNIPVIGNGDIKSCFDAKKMLDETKCDAVMIGRGVLGNPWLIKECVDYLDNNTLPKEVSYIEKIDMMKNHYELLVQDKGEIGASLEIRTFVLYYLKGLPGSKEVKNTICKTKSSKEMFNIIDDYKKQLDKVYS